MSLKETKSWCIRCGSYSNFYNPSEKIIKTEKVLGGTCSQCSAFKFLVAPKSKTQSETKSNKAFYYYSLSRYYLGEFQRYMNLVAFVALLSLGGYLVAKAHFGAKNQIIDEILDYTVHEVESITKTLVSANNDSKDRLFSQR